MLQQTVTNSNKYGPTPSILKSSKESLGKSKCIQTNVHHMGKHYEKALQVLCITKLYVKALCESLTDHDEQFFQSIYHSGFYKNILNYEKLISITSKGRSLLKSAGL